MNRAAQFSLFALLLCVFSRVGWAQPNCATQWLPGLSPPGLNGPVHALVNWDHDSNQTTPSIVVVGGSFSVAGVIQAQNVATWNPLTQEWQALGSGFDGPVNSLCVSTDGDLYAGGQFATSGSSTLGGVGRWNGSEWLPVGGGVGGVANHNVSSMIAVDEGGVIAGGTFTLAGSVPVNHVAKWNGSVWIPLGSGLFWRKRSLSCDRFKRKCVRGWFI
jgi:hypothetical protein